MRPTDLEYLGPDVWSPEGIKIFGTPLVGGGETTVGSYLVGARHTVRMADPASVRESEMSPLLQTIPPRQSETYADGHDESMWRAGSSNVLGILGGLPVHVAEEASRGDHTLHGSVGRGSQRPRVSGRVVFSKQAAAPEWVRCQARLDPVAGGVEPSPTCFL